MERNTPRTPSHVPVSTSRPDEPKANGILKGDHTELLKETSRNFGAHDIAKWLEREDSTLTVYEKAKVRQEVEAYFENKGLGRGR